MGVDVLPYSDSWPVLFAQEAERLAAVLQPWLADGIHHIGSTSVPGLAAKPVLDMMAGVHDLEAAREAVPVLAELGYRHAQHRPHEALWFYKQSGEDYARRTHQLHLTRPGSDLWRERLAFRDALRSDPQLRAAYAALKHDLARESDDLAAYTAGKRQLVVDALARQGIQLGQTTHRLPT